MAYKRTIIITSGEYQKYYEGMYGGEINKSRGVEVFPV